MPEKLHDFKIGETVVFNHLPRAKAVIAGFENQGKLYAPADASAFPFVRLISFDDPVRASVITVHYSIIKHYVEEIGL